MEVLERVLLVRAGVEAAWGGGIPGNTWKYRVLD